jgi:hypothetical protein
VSLLARTFLNDIKKNLLSKDENGCRLFFDEMPGDYHIAPKRESGGRDE